MRPTGCLKDHAHRRNARVAAASIFWRDYQSLFGERPPDSLIGFVLRYHDQGMGSCIGESLMGMVEAVCPQWGALSGVKCWTDARRRDGLLLDPDVGTYPVRGLESLQLLGPVPYHPGEEDDRAYATCGETWEEGMIAADRRQSNLWVEHHTIEPNAQAWELVRQLMAKGWQVQICTGTTDKYQFRDASDANTPAGLDELGGEEGGHAQRILGWLDPETPVVQNSWGARWGGAVSAGRVLYGACPAKIEVIENAWEINAIKIAA